MTMKDNGEPRKVPIQDLFKLIRNQEGHVVDVRTTTEFARGHIEGARNIPLRHLKERAGEFGKSLEDPVVVVSRSGKRARQAQALLEEAGLSDIRVLEDGDQAWRQAEMPYPALQDPDHEDRMQKLARTIRLASGVLSLAGAVAGVVRKKNMRLLAGMALGGLLVAGLSNGRVVQRVMDTIPRNSRHFDVDRVLGDLARGNQ